MTTTTSADPMLPHGSQRCRCAACGQYFTVVSAFDKHQRLGNDGRPICRDPASVGLTLNEAGYWRYPGTNPLFPTRGEIPEREEEGGLVSAVVSTQEALF